MKCTYEFNGKTFNSELELDDFLLSGGHTLYSAYGDMVFSKTSAQLMTMSRTDSLKEEGITRLKEKFTKDVEVTPDHGDIETESVKKPYNAVTEVLRNLINIETGKLMFPDFRPEFTNEEGHRDGYFPRKEVQWKAGNFTTREVLDFFDGDVSKIPSTITDLQIKDFRKVLENKWLLQAKIGTEIHKVLQNIFKTVTTKEGKTLEFYKLSEDKLYEYINENINKDFLSELNIRDVISYGKGLYKYLSDKLGDDLTFYPEYIIWGDYVDMQGEQQKMLGKIDLLVVDSKGNTHIIDYKTSPEDYSKPMDTDGGYSSAKVLAFKYQLGVYNLLLQALGIGNALTLHYVAPMLLLDFKKNSEGKWTFDGLKNFHNFLDNISANVEETATILANLKQYFINLSVLDESIDDLLTNYLNNISKLFNSTEKIKDEYSDDDITAIILKKSTVNKATSMIEFKTGSGQIKKFKTERELRDWLKKAIKRNKNKLEIFTSRLAEVINVVTKGDEPTIYESLFPTFEFNDGTSTWINTTLKRYYTGNYSVINTEAAKALQKLGVILVLNKHTNAVDVITVSDEVLFAYNILARGRKKITAKFTDDITEEMESKDTFESLNGNIELMKTMLLLNAIPETLRGKSINEMRVINPVLGSGTWASNELIMHNFKRLTDLSALKGKALEANNFTNNAIAFHNSYQLFVNEYETIIKNHIESTDFKWQKFVSATTTFDKEVTGFDNKITLLADLKQLKELMESIFPHLRLDYEWELTDDAALLYFRVNKAISFLNNVNYIQQFADSDRILDSINIFKSGVSGTRIDNPGRLKNENLNKSVYLTTLGYLNLRQELLLLKAELRLAIADLKKAKGFGYLGGRLFKNKVDLFKPLFERGNDIENDTDLVLKRLDDPSLANEPELKKVLDLTLRVINKNRHADKSEAELQAMRDSGSLDYYRLPLTPGKMNSTISAEGLLNALRSRLKFLLPSKAKQDAINREAGFELKEEDIALITSDSELRDSVDIPIHSIHRANIWEMTNMFDAGETELGRLRLIEENGLTYFERDLETLVLKHEFAYRQAEIMNDVLPLIKAGVLDIQYQQLMLGHKYTEDINYLKDYVKNKIFNKSLVEDKYKAVLAYKSGFMRTASMLALGFNPKQFYQTVEGLWKDIKLIITKPDGKYNFSSKDMIRAFKEVAMEAFHYGDKRSMLELINEFYALNDMDMHPDVYVEKLIDDKSLMYNFQTVMFRFASRPDFYNRLAIFRAHMYADKTVQAHYIKDGVLVYDWKLDPRFADVANHIENGKTIEQILQMAIGNEKLSKLLGMYLRYVEQMALEGTRVIDKNTGQRRLIKRGDILPKAYTTNQSEAYKSVADILYGYYAHEKKALIQSELVGSLMLLMYTYWSGKKNQYFLTSGVKINGHYERLEIDGVPYFMDSNGNPTTTDTGVAYIKWRGRFEEGILLTLNHIRELIILGALEYDKGLFTGLPLGVKYMRKNMFKEVPEELRDAYMHNLKAISYDLGMWSLIGLFAFRSLFELSKEYIKENEADNLAQAITNNSLSLGANLLKTSVMDFNFMESIGGRGIDWTPFSISMMKNTYDNWMNFLTGSQTLKKTVMKSTSATRQVHEVFDYIWKDPEE